MRAKDETSTSNVLLAHGIHDPSVAIGAHVTISACERSIFATPFHAVDHGGNLFLFTSTFILKL